MLGSLTILVILLVLIPKIHSHSDPFNIEKIIDYSKWVLTTLLAAFGAWIGAGAAYFFGKENLRLSSESTQQALKLQEGYAKSRSELALVKDINLTPLNPNFKFSMDTKIKDVFNELGKNVDYWFVPIIEKEKLIDTVHTEAFWRYDKDKNEAEDKDKNEKKIEDVINYIKTDKKLEQKRAKLHGFFLEVKMEDSVLDVADLMKIKDISVGIVCDKDSKPTHCFTRKDLRSFQLASS